ncbi:MAG: glutamylcysteine synthetase [Ruminococcus sp.]|nr:glutamylcysteine synthetase [Ruminococcus sp.]
MTDERLSEAIYEKYIEPTDKHRSSMAGIEIELPVVNMSGDAVDESLVIEAADKFREHFGFEAEGRDDNGNVNSMTFRQTGDNLSFDCSYSNLELSLGKGDDLCAIHESFKKYYGYMQSLLQKNNYTLTGMGINPHYNINHNKPVPNERYRMLYHYLHSYHRYEGKINMSFHNRPDFGTFTSASQVQLDVERESLIDTINAFTLLEPYKALLFANSYLPEYPEYLCARNMLWEHSMQGFNPHNVGMFGSRLQSVDELIEYIKSQSVYCTMRDGRYIDFKPTAVKDYFTLGQVRGEFFDGEKYIITEFTPDESDLKYLRTFKFEDLTFRGTIEYRSSCTQPIKDVMTVAAFHTGLSGRLEELTALVESDRTLYRHGFTPVQLQDMLSKRELPGFIDKQQLSRQLIRILDIAAAGLKDRQKGEEKFLKPLYTRAEKLTNPAKEMLRGLESDTSMDEFIELYSAV